MKKVLVDTDILSMFAKAEALSVLIEFLGKNRIGMTPAIADEASVPLQYGYDFPLQILARIPTVSLSQTVTQQSIRLHAQAPFLGHGEREAIAFCQEEGADFVTNDRQAREFARTQEITVFSLQTLLRAVWLSGIRTKTETRALLERLKHADNVKIMPETEEKIFESHEAVAPASEESPTGQED